MLKPDPQTQRNMPLNVTGVSRREFVQSLCAACAGLLSQGVLAGTTAPVREVGGPVRTGKILSKPQMHLLRELAEIIIPETDTPGAATTDVHGFIDDQLAVCRAPDEAKWFMRQLDLVGESVQQHYGEVYPGLSPQERLVAMDALAHHRNPFDNVDPGFFFKLKALTVVAYYSSEAGAAQELVYLPVPGGYSGDFKVSDNNGKAFSPHVF